MRLRRNRWQKFVTSDEALFYLSDSGGRRQVQYISRGKTTYDCERYSKPKWPKGVMVWCAIS